MGQKRSRRSCGQNAGLISLSDRVRNVQHLGARYLASHADNDQNFRTVLRWQVTRSAIGTETVLTRSQSRDACQPVQKNHMTTGPQQPTPTRAPHLPSQPPLCAWCSAVACGTAHRATLTCEVSQPSLSTMRSKWSCWRLMPRIVVSVASFGMLLLLRLGRPDEHRPPAPAPPHDASLLFIPCNDSSAPVRSSVTFPRLRSPNCLPPPLLP